MTRFIFEMLIEVIVEYERFLFNPSLIAKKNF